jgi:hypothetical protein
MPATRKLKRRGRFKRATWRARAGGNLFGSGARFSGGVSAGAENSCGGAVLLGQDEFEGELKLAAAAGRQLGCGSRREQGGKERDGGKRIVVMFGEPDAQEIHGGIVELAVVETSEEKPKDLGAGGSGELRGCERKAQVV